MKKSLTFKFMIMFSSIMIISLVLFLIVSANVFKKKNIEVNNAKLIQFVTSTTSSWTDGKMTDKGFEYVYGSNTSVDWSASSNILKVVDNSKINSIIRDFKASKSFKISPIVKEYDNGKIYACGYSVDGKFIIAFSDNSSITSQTISLVGTTSLIFFLIILLANITMYLYSRRIINRINDVKKEILDLPKNEYKKEIGNYGIDEIGDLANGAENLRLFILDESNKRQEMFQNLSHDLKTPIAVIKSYGEAIKDGIEDINSIDVILNQSEILERKTNKLLELNKIEYIKNTNFEDINMYDLINSTVINYKNNKIRFEMKLENVSFKGFYENYRIVLENLIENALRYAKSVIKIELRDNELTIFNDGKPIEEDIMENMFEAYVKGIDGNFGVGLSIVKRTLAVFGYNILAINQDEGVIFKIFKMQTSC